MMMFLLKSFLEFLNYLQEFNTISILIRMILAVIFGGLIGIEREKRHFGTGSRTFGLVCLGSCVTIIVNEYVRIKSNNTIDPTRIAAQIINGIGFLGAGTIMVTGNNRVKGLTTAASLWVSAIIGIAVGAGFIYGAFLGFAFALASVTILQRYNHWFSNFDRMIEFYMEIDPDEGMNQIREFAKENNFIIKSIHRKRQKPLTSDDLCITVEFDMCSRRDHGTVRIIMQNVQGIHYFEEI